LSQLGTLQSPEGFSVPPGDKTTAESLLGGYHNSGSKNDPRYQTILRKLQISSNFFRASIFAARIQFVSAAGSGDDFSNNLFTDLAPILTLFGEQVA
jgi:hypothetical protein